jgi:protein-tyrosine-phosphatase
MAAALLRSRAAELAIPVTVSSAGFLFDGRAAEPDAVEQLQRQGVDLRGHQARTLSPELLRHADLVIAMEARHLRDIVVMEDVFERTFTFPELVERAEEAGARRPGEELADWIARVGAGRTRGEMLRNRPEWEVEDPMNRSRRVFRRCGEQLADLVDRFVTLAWPGAVPGGQHALSNPTPRSS